MPNLGPWEIILILAVVLMIFGPSKLPEIGKSLGSSIREFRKATTDVQESVRLDVQPTAPAAQVSQAAPGAGTGEPGAGA